MIRSLTHDRLLR